MCGKGYARINEFEAHENSYDHQHRKRLKEMKALTRNPTAAVRDNRAEKKRKEKSEMLSLNLQTESGGARPSNAVGFRDATQVRSVPGTGSGNAPVAVGATKGFPSDGQQKETPQVEEDKVMRPPMWDELDNFYNLVDASALPREMQQKDVKLPWADIWTDNNEMDRLVEAVRTEMDTLDGGQARKDLDRVWDDMSESSDVDELHPELDG